MRLVAYSVNGKFDGSRAGLQSVVQKYKQFTAGWQWIGNDKLSPRMTLSTSNIGRIIPDYPIGYSLLTSQHSLLKVFQRGSLIFLVLNERDATVS